MARLLLARCLSTSALLCHFLRDECIDLELNIFESPLFFMDPPFIGHVHFALLEPWAITGMSGSFRSRIANSPFRAAHAHSELISRPILVNSLMRKFIQQTSIVPGLPRASTRLESTLTRRDCLYTGQIWSRGRVNAARASHQAGRKS